MCELDSNFSCGRMLNKIKNSRLKLYFFCWEPWMEKWGPSLHYFVECLQIHACTYQRWKLQRHETKEGQILLFSQWKNNLGSVNMVMPHKMNWYTHVRNYLLDSLVFCMYPLITRIHYFHSLWNEGITLRKCFWVINTLTVFSGI